MHVSMVRALHAVLLVLGMAAGPARAADPAPPPSAPVTATTPPAPIPESDILVAAEQDQRLVDRVKRRLSGTDPTAQLQKELDTIARPVDQKRGTLDPDQLRRLPIMRLESLARHWKFDAVQFDRWQTELGQLVAPYSTDAAALSRRRAAWSATRAAAASDPLLPLLSERVDAMLGSFTAVEQQMAVAIAQQIELRQHADAVQAKIQEGQAEVDAAISDLDRRLFQLDAPPLWSSAPDVRRDDPSFNPLDRGVDIEVAFAKAYAAASPSNLRQVRVLELALLPLLLWLSWRSRHAPAGTGGGADTSRVLGRPLSMWVLLSMMAVLTLEPDAPLLVHEFAMLAALVPVLRLMPQRSLKLLHAWPYVVTGLFVLDRLGVSMLSGGPHFRLAQLALSTLALVLTLWLMRRSRETHAAGGTTGRALRAIEVTGAVLLAIAAAANVVGNVSLAATLTSGVVGSGYFALLLFAGVTVCVALLTTLVGLPEMRRARLVKENATAVLGVSTKLLQVGAAVGWLVSTMAEFRMLRPARVMLSAVLAHDFEVGELSISIGHLLVFAVSVFIAFWSARIVRRMLRAELHDRAVLPRGVGNSVASLSYYAVLLLGLLFALSAAGFKVSQLALVFGALGVGIGFGLQTIVANFVSGLVLMFERPIQPGDVIEVGTTSGRVREIGMRATIVRTFEGADVLIPNSSLLAGNLVNWTLYDRHRRIEVQVPLAYGTDPDQAMAILLAAATGTTGIAAEPAPSVYFVGYADSALNFSVRVWTHDFENWVAIRSELLSRLLRAVAAAGLSIPFNQYDLNVRSVSPNVAELLAGGADRQAPTR